MQGIIQAVQTSPGGDFPLEPAAAGATVLSFADASDFDPIGGQLDIDGAVLDYVSADLDEDTVTVAEPLAFDVAEDIFVATVPATQSAHATVVLDDDIVLAEVPHHLKPMLPEGLREPGAGEAVVIEEVAVGAYRVADVAGSRPAFDGEAIHNADEMLLASRQKLGEKLAENDAAITQAQGALSTAQQRINDAFSDIELKPDQSYVDAAKQQAIDAAEVEAREARDAAIEVANSKTTAIFSETPPEGTLVVDNGDGTYTLTAPDIVDHGDGTFTVDTPYAVDNGAGTYILSPPLGGFPLDAQWVDGDGRLSRWDGAQWVTASDPKALADAARSAAVQDAQEALTLAEQDLAAAIVSGDADAIADAEAKIATAKQEAIAAAEAYTSAQFATAMGAATDAMTAAQQAQATADGAIRTYYASTPPWADGTTQPDDVLGDMWFDLDNGQAYRWNGTTWQVIQDNTIGEALAAAQNAQATADGKITTYYQNGPPGTAPGSHGDLWIDGSDDSTWRYQNDAWAKVSDPAALADDALADAKAYTVTMTDGLAKGVESTALPGTTVMPKDSVWRVVDAQGNYSAVFVQTASPSGSTWEARAITSEVIDNLDVGKLTAAQSVIDDQVANTFAAKLANLIEANIGNLTVTGDTHLNSVVAERVAGDVASFVKITADNIIGRLIEGVDIVGSTITGSTVQTNESGVYPRLAMDGFYGLTVFNSAGFQTFTLNPEGSLTARDVQLNGEFSTDIEGSARAVLKEDVTYGVSGVLELHSELPEESDPAQVLGGVVPPFSEYGLHLISPKFGAGAKSTITVAGERAIGEQGTPVGGGIFMDTGGPSGLIHQRTSGAEMRVNSASVEVGHGGANAMWWLNDGQRGVRSMDIYNRTYGSSANVFITSAGTLGRATSATKYKIAPEPLRDVEDSLLSLTPKTWFDKSAAEAVADHITSQAEGETVDDSPTPYDDVDELRRIPGLIAEDVDAAGLSEFVVRDESGEVEGLMYDRIAVALIPTVKRQRDRIAALEDRLAALEAHLTTPTTGA